MNGFYNDYVGKSWVILANGVKEVLLKEQQLLFIRY